MFLSTAPWLLLLSCTSLVYGAGRQVNSWTFWLARKRKKVKTHNIQFQLTAVRCCIHSAQTTQTWPSLTPKPQGTFVNEVVPHPFGVTPSSQDPCYLYAVPLLSSRAKTRHERTSVGTTCNPKSLCMCLKKTNMVHSYTRERFEPLMKKKN